MCSNEQCAIKFASPWHLRNSDIPFFSFPGFVVSLILKYLFESIFMIQRSGDKTIFIDSRFFFCNLINPNAIQ